jgi:hypothetical protein
VNTDAPTESDLMWAERRVLEIQAKLHRWAGEDRSRRFDDVFNLVADPDFLLVAWERVRSNTGARTAGIDGLTARRIEAGGFVPAMLHGLRDQLVSNVSPGTGPGAVDPEVEREAAPARHTNGDRPDRAGIAEAGP